MSLPIPLVPQSWHVPTEIDVTPHGQLTYKTQPPRLGIAVRERLGQPPAGFAEANSEMVDGFLELAEATDEQIQEYALDFGVLRLCAHGRPAHWHLGGPSGLACEPVAFDYEDDGYRFVELTAEWRTIARAFSALVHGAEQIELGRALDRLTLDRLAWFNGGSPFDEGHDRLAIADAANYLLSGAVRLQMDYTADGLRPSLRFAGRSLADALALQVALKVTKSPPAYVCDGCGSIYTSDRKPRHRQNKYCAACRQAGVPQRLATQRFRASRRGDSANG